MEVLDVLRTLSQRRFLLVVGLLATIAVALLLSRGGTPPGAVAKTRVVLDTPDSQLVKVAPAGVDTLLWRAGLVANLVASEAMTEEITRLARIPADQLAVV